MPSASRRAVTSTSSCSGRTIKGLQAFAPFNQPSKQLLRRFTWMVTAQIGQGQRLSGLIEIADDLQLAPDGQTAPEGNLALLIGVIHILSQHCHAHILPFA